ncbi:MAG TPA: hypothetical protein VEC13_03100 [Candidatus Paceibacterota bacterium]|nr:hypothetical protein [Candidatus Paceibacterota bacterium]
MKPVLRKKRRKRRDTKVSKKTRFRVKLVDLCALLKAEPKLFTGRISPKNLTSLKKKGLCYFLQNDKEIFGMVALWPTKNPAYFELGTLWVKVGFRCYGHSAALFDKALSLVPKGSTVFLITNEKRVIKLAMEHQWDEALEWQTSEGWRKVYEPWKGTRKDPSSSSQLFYTIVP